MKFPLETKQCLKCKFVFMNSTILYSYSKRKTLINCSLEEADLELTAYMIKQIKQTAARRVLAKGHWYYGFIESMV